MPDDFTVYDPNGGGLDPVRDRRTPSTCDSGGGISEPNIHYRRKALRIPRCNLFLVLCTPHSKDCVAVAK